MPVAGVHLMPSVREAGGARPSAVAVMGDEGVLHDLRLAGADPEVAGAVPAGVAVACVDAPLAVPGGGGRRDVERVLAWCDVPAFPVSRERLLAVHGGARGEALAPLLAGRAGRLLEALPSLVLRQLMWEAERGAGAPPLPLADYRRRWIGVRPPAYRARGRTAGPALLRAYALVAAAVDLGGWAPSGDEAAAGDDAARLDAVLCAYAALRVVRGDAVVLGTAERGALAVPADANLRERLAVNLARLRAEGAVGI